jgi:hypothetical protein
MSNQHYLCQVKAPYSDKRIERRVHRVKLDAKSRKAKKAANVDRTIVSLTESLVNERVPIRKSL